MLRKLYGEVLIPDVVASELTDSDAPSVVAEWALHLPVWIEVRPTPRSDEKLGTLDEGERAAILLAEAQSAPVLLLIDDADGRAEAERRNIPTTGTVGVLRGGAIRKVVDLPAALARLRTTNFRCPSVLLEELLVEDARRKAAQE